MVQLNYRDTKPIYEQVKQGLRRLVISHAILPNEQLPSVRELAAALTINPNTIQRAYRDLEAEGYLYSLPGKGTFAGENASVPAHRQEFLFGQFDETVTELLFLSVPPEELTSRIAHLAEGSGFQ